MSVLAWPRSGLRMHDWLALHPHVLVAPITYAYIKKLLAFSPIAYWPLNEASGSAAVCHVDSPTQDGTHDGVTLGQTGIGDGNTCPLYDGTGDDTDLYSASLAAAFDGAEGTAALWLRVANAGVWTDSTPRYALNLRSSGADQIYVTRSANDGQMRIVYEAGDTAKATTVAGLSTTDWIHVAITWSASADQVIAYWNGAQQGPTLTGLATWEGALSTTTTRLASWNGAQQFWHGYLAHAAVWDTVLSAANIATLASV